MYLAGICCSVILLGNYFIKYLFEKINLDYSYISSFEKVVSLHLSYKIKIQKTFIITIASYNLYFELIQKISLILCIMLRNIFLNCKLMLVH